MSVIAEAPPESFLGGRPNRKSDAASAGPVEAFRRWYRKRNTFRALTQLDDRLLADIGVARGDIARVASRS